MRGKNAEHTFVDMYSSYEWCKKGLTHPFENTNITADNFQGVNQLYLLPLKNLIKKYPLQKEVNSPELSLIQSNRSGLR